MPKLRKFLWQLCHACLLGVEMQFKRAMIIDPLCPFYQFKIDDPDHLLLYCHFIREHWRLAITYNWIDASFLSNQ